MVSRREAAVGVRPAQRIAANGSLSAAEKKQARGALPQHKEEFPISESILRLFGFTTKVSGEGMRLQVLTPKGVPLQVLRFGAMLRGLCADEQRVWMTAANMVGLSVRAVLLK